MKALALIVFGGLAAVFFAGQAASAAGLGSTELITHAAQYEGQMVIYRGEVIGDVMGRGAYAWVNVSDGQNALGIWAQKAMVAGIRHTGGYQTQGDTIAVEGVFHHRCLEHGGDLDIHARRVELVAAGGPTAEALAPAKYRAALLLGGAALLLWTLTRSKNK